MRIDPRNGDSRHRTRPFHLSGARHRPLYFMVKPPMSLGGEIAALGATRDAGLLHITLLPAGDRLESPPGFVEALQAAGSRVCAPSFHIVFDRLVGSGRTLALRGSEPIRGALAFQRSLVHALTDIGLFTPPDYRFVPHITLDYSTAMQAVTPIEPISWLVDSFMLIESVTGAGRHIAHARWSLQPR